MLTREQIEQYEQELDETYKREKDAVKIMRRLLDQAEGRINGNVSVSTSALSPQPQNSVLPPLDPNLNTPTLAKRIEQALQEFPDEQWTMRRMLQYLKNVHFQLNENPEGGISATLGKLAKMGKLKVIRQGAGSVASIYQWNSKSEPDFQRDQIVVTTRQGGEEAVEDIEE